MSRGILLIFILLTEILQGMLLDPTQVNEYTYIHKQQGNYMIYDVI